MRPSKLILLLLASIAAACAPDREEPVTDAGTTEVDAGTPPAPHDVAGTVTGLKGTGLVLALATEVAAVAADGDVRFQTKVMSGDAFEVTVKKQPTNPTQTCVITGGAGTMGDVDAAFTVTCTTDKFPIGGKVTGLKGAGLKLSLNTATTLEVTKDGDFTFTGALESGTAWEVAVATQPTEPWQDCVVDGGTASGTVGAAAVTTVEVTCTTLTFELGGTVTGLVGTVVLTSGTGGETAQEITITAEGPFKFPTPYESGTSYDVKVTTSPTGPSQTCTIEEGTGVVGGDNIDTVTVACVTNSYKIGGTVTGLVGTGLTLSTGDEELVLTADGAFQFVGGILSGGSFEVEVTANPTSPWQTCTIADGTEVGDVTTADVNTIEITCVTEKFAVGGTITGLTGSITLANGAVERTFTVGGGWAFADDVESGALYTVEIKTQPTGLTCTIANETGTVGGDDVGNIDVTCTANTYDLGGSVATLNGEVTLLNGTEELKVTTSGDFKFLTKVAFGAGYEVTVKTQPVGQTCTVTAGKATMGAAAVTTVAVACATNTYKLGGNATGLGGSLVLMNGTGNELTVTADGAFAFETKVAYGADYDVTIKTQPTGRTCTLENGKSKMGAADVTAIAVACTKNTYTLGGSIAALNGTLVLMNGADEVSVTNATTFTLPTKVAYDADYDVKVKTQPAAMNCSVANGKAKMGAANVTNVEVTCSASLFAVGGKLSGLNGTVVLQNNGANDLTLTADGDFVFTTKLAPGADYAVTVKTNPANQDCGVSFGNAKVGTADVTAVRVTCTAKVYAVGGAISGLIGTVVLQNNLTNDLTLTADGNFAFTTKLAKDADYSVTVKTQPAGVACSVTGTTGVGKVGTADVTTVAIACVDASMVMVVRLGTGAAALAATTSEVFLDEIKTSDGTSPRTVTIPATGTTPLTMSGTASSEGQLARSVDGKYVTFVGYSGVAGTAGTGSTATTQRAVGRVDSAGNVDASTKLGASVHSGVNSRAAVSVDGTAYWVTGGNTGPAYVVHGGTAAIAVSTVPANTRGAGIFGGQLFVSASTGTGGNYFGLASVGTGLPTTAGQTTTALPGFPVASGPSTYGFAMFDNDSSVAGLDLAYVADDRTTANVGGVQRWKFNGTAWTLEATFQTLTAANVGARALTAKKVGTKYVIFAVTAESSANRLITLTDDLVSATPTVTTIKTAATNTIFRGVAFSPVP